MQDDTTQDFPTITVRVGTRVRFVGDVYSELQGKMATVVEDADIAASWPGRPGPTPGTIACRLDDIGQHHLYWGPKPRNIEIVAGPSRPTRYMLNKDEMTAYVDMLERFVNIFKHTGASADFADGRELSNNAEFAIKKLRVICNNTKRGVAPEPLEPDA